MELPDELIMIINAYAKPLTRPDWKQGSYIIKNSPNICKSVIRLKSSPFQKSRIGNELVSIYIRNGNRY